MSKGGYIWIYIGFCSVVVHFLGGAGYIRLVVGCCGWWWMVVCGGAHILAGGGWWWMVVDGGIV